MYGRCRGIVGPIFSGYFLGNIPATYIKSLKFPLKQGKRVEYPVLPSVRYKLHYSTFHCGRLVRYNLRIIPHQTSYYKPNDLHSWLRSARDLLRKVEHVPPCHRSRFQPNCPYAIQIARIAVWLSGSYSTGWEFTPVFHGRSQNMHRIDSDLLGKA